MFLQALMQFRPCNLWLADSWEAHNKGLEVSLINAYLPYCILVFFLFFFFEDYKLPKPLLSLMIQIHALIDIGMGAQLLELSTSSCILGVY